MHCLRVSFMCLFIFFPSICCSDRCDAFGTFHAPYMCYVFRVSYFVYNSRVQKRRRVPSLNFFRLYKFDSISAFLFVTLRYTFSVFTMCVLYLCGKVNYTTVWVARRVKKYNLYMRPCVSCVRAHDIWLGLRETPRARVRCGIIESNWGKMFGRIYIPT